MGSKRMPVALAHPCKRGAGMRRFIGLDVPKAYPVPQRPRGVAQFCAALDGSAHVALEVTSDAYRCRNPVSPDAGRVLLVNPSALRRLGVKTDKLDAKTMAEQVALGLIPEVWVPPAPPLDSST